MLRNDRGEFSALRSRLEMEVSTASWLDRVIPRLIFSCPFGLGWRSMHGLPLARKVAIRAHGVTPAGYLRYLALESKD